MHKNMPFQSTKFIKFFSGEGHTSTFAPSPPLPAEKSYIYHCKYGQNKN